MTAKNDAHIARLKAGIGYQAEPVRDAQGHWVIGYGRRLNDKPGGPKPEAYWSEQFADEELRHRVAAARDGIPQARELAAMGRGGDTEIAHLNLRNVASTLSNLRSQAFNNAANLGMADANRFLQGDTANQGANLAASTANAANALSASQGNAANALSASQANSANALSADTFNSNLLNQRQQFDINSANQAQQMRMDALRGRDANIGAQSNMAVQNALNLLNSGTITTNQLMDLLKSGTATFGSETNAQSNNQSTQKKSGNLLGDLIGIAGAVSGLKTAFK